MSKHSHISLPTEVIIGKDILELISSSMYVDPLAIYREYIQNSADSIDAAKAAHILKPKSLGRIDITFDQTARSVKIRDNGAGVPSGEFAQRLTSIGGSAKRGTSARGFRGIGRLAGLGYCQELIFRSRSIADSTVQELHWDCRKFKSLLLDHTYKGSLHDLIEKIASVRNVPATGWPAHFYEVELIKPIRIKNDILMSPDVISHYLSQVSPVPFSPQFRFGHDIYAKLSHHLPLGEVEIFINSAERPLYRPYRNEYSYKESKRDKLSDVEFRLLENMDGNLAAILWIAHHGYRGAIPSTLGVGGLRARKGNIQVGDYRIFSEAFPEARFTSWAIGELHIIDDRVVPNGRRDDFEPNSHFAHLISQLHPVGEHIAKLCRSSSAVRNRIRAFDIGALKVDEQLGILKQGGLKKGDVKRVIKDVRQKLFDIKNTANSSILTDHDRAILLESFANLEKRAIKIEKKALSSSSGERFSPRDQALLDKLINLIYECSTNKVAAQTLVSRILARLGKRSP